MNQAIKLRWVMLKKYCELTNDTENAVNQRKRTGKWRQGIHYTTRDGRVWVNLEAVAKWVEHGEDYQPAPQSARASKQHHRITPPSAVSTG